MEAYDEYAWALPLSHIEELSETPKSQAELEAPASIILECGFYRYRFEVTDAASGYPRLMTIKSGKFDGISRSAFDVDIQEKRSGPQ